MRRLLTSRELSEAIGLTPEAIRLLAKRPENPIPSFKAGGHYRFGLDEVLDWMRQNAQTKAERNEVTT